MATGTPAVDLLAPLQQRRIGCGSSAAGQPAQDENEHEGPHAVLRT
jgi:hypothetical protein